MASTESATPGININPATSPTHGARDPFAGQRSPNNDPFAHDKLGNIAGGDEMRLDSASPPQDRRSSREWDASKVPPSQFQKRKGSIYSTPSTRDGHVKGTDRDKAYFEKLKEKGWLPK